MRCRVRARSFLIFPLPRAPLTKKDKLALTSAEQTPKERERTNKSARAVRRRDIVSCEVNHLRGSKTASSPRKNPFAASSLHLCSRRPRGETFVTYVRASWHREPIATFSFIFLLLLLLFFASFLLSLFAVSPVSVNMRTHGLVISVIGSLTPARRHPFEDPWPRFFCGMAGFLGKPWLDHRYFERDRLVIDSISR